MDTKLKIQCYEDVEYTITYSMCKEHFVNEDDALNRCAVLADMGICFDLRKTERAILGCV